MGSRFDIYRKRADQEGEAEKQKRVEALQRRAAALGNSGSGAAMKQEQVAANDVAEQTMKAKEGIQFAEMEDTSRKEEIDQARKYQTGEREAGQAFSSSMMDKQFGFAKGEREAAQGFAHGEREASQRFSAEESSLARALQSRGLDLQDTALKEQASQFEKTFGMATSQFDLDAYISLQNLVTASGKGDRSAIKLPPELMKMFGLDEQGLFAPTPQSSAPAGTVSAEPPALKPGQSSKEARREWMSQGWVFQNGQWFKPQQ